MSTTDISTQTVSHTTTARTTATTAHWGGVFAMTLCVFSLIASEFMPVSLLTPLAAELGVSEGVAGQGITISAVFAVLTSLTISRLAANLDRKHVLLGLTLAMAVSGALVALAPNFTIYLIGRALIGVVIGGFWSLSAATAMRLVPKHQVPRALAIFNGGNALASVIAAPLGSYLGVHVGWRGAFLCLVPIALAAFAWQAVSLPPLPPLPTLPPLPPLPATPTTPTAPKSVTVFSALRRRPVALGMAASGVFFAGQFMLFTYIRPFLEVVTNVGDDTLSIALLTLGAAGLVGTSLVGNFISRGLYRTIAAIPVLMAVIALALIPWGASLVPVLVLLALWGLLSTAAPVGWWSWLARAMPRDAEVGGGLMVAVIQLSIGIGSMAGGVLFDGFGYAATFSVAAGVLLVGAALTLLTARASRA